MICLFFVVFEAFQKKLPIMLPYEFCKSPYSNIVQHATIARKFIAFPTTFQSLSNTTLQVFAPFSCFTTIITASGHSLHFYCKKHKQGRSMPLLFPFAYKSVLSIKEFNTKLLQTDYNPVYRNSCRFLL